MLHHFYINPTLHPKMSDALHSAATGRPEWDSGGRMALRTVSPEPQVDSVTVSTTLHEWHGRHRSSHLEAIPSGSPSSRTEIQTTRLEGCHRHSSLPRSRPLRCQPTLLSLGCRELPFSGRIQLLPTPAQPPFGGRKGCTKTETSYLGRAPTSRGRGGHARSSRRRNDTLARTSNRVVTSLGTT